MRHVVSTALAVCTLAAVIGTDASGNAVYAWGHRYGYHGYSYAPRYSYSYRAYPYYRRYRSYRYDYSYYPRHHHYWHHRYYRHHRHWR